jgi:hypothetical protein
MWEVEVELIGNERDEDRRERASERPEERWAAETRQVGRQRNCYRIRKTYEIVDLNETTVFL